MHSKIHWLYILAGAALVFISGLQSLLNYAFSPFPIDDLYIVFIYAKHLVNNFEFYYNAIGDHTDGFTSLLDVLLKASLYLTNPERILENSIHINQLLTLLIPVCFWIFVVKHCKSWQEYISIFAFSLLISRGEMLQTLAWITVETPLFTLLGLLFCLGFTVPEKSLTGKILPVLFGALWIMSRPEALFLIFIAQILFLIINKRFHSSFLLLGIFVFLYVSSRIFIFGHWAPNTYYAKRSGNLFFEIGDGISFVANHLVNSEVAVGIGLAIFVFISIYRNIEPGNLRHFQMLILSAFSIAGTSLLILSGGDTYYWTLKFVIPYVLFGYFAAGAYLISSGYNILNASLVCIAFLTILVSFLKQEKELSASAYLKDIEERVAIIRLQEKCDTILATKLEKHFPGKKTGQSDFQKLKFVNDNLNVTDLSGLNDKEIAHMAFDNRNIFGKFKLDNVMLKDIDVYFVSYGFRSRRSVALADPGKALSNRESIEEYMSFPYEESPEMFQDKMTLGSIKACGWYYNFLIKKSLVNGRVFIDESDTSETAP